MIRQSIWRLLVWGLALACAGAAVAAHGGRASDWLDVLTHFAPFWLAGGLAAIVAAFGVTPGWPRQIPIVLGAIAVVAAAGLMAPEYLRPIRPDVPAGGQHQIKIIQFNAKGDQRPREVAARWIVDQQPDLIVMEEVTPQIRDAVLALHRYHVAPDPVTCPECRVVIMSRKAPVDTGLRDEWLSRWIAPMARMTFAEADGGFTIMGAHETWPYPPGRQQAGFRQLAEMLDHFPKDRLILTGDFNSTPWSFALQRADKRFGMERRDRALFSWPAGPLTVWLISPPFAFLPIDHVYAGSAWRTVKIERGPRGLGSDHLPLVTTLALQPR